MRQEGVTPKEINGLSEVELTREVVFAERRDPYCKEKIENTEAGQVLGLCAPC
jgi:hypothetical protein